VHAHITEGLLIRQTQIGIRSAERRIITFTVFAFALTFVWLLLAPIFSYEPSFPDFYSPPGTELAIYRTP